jgi:hypothetical protein
MSEAIIGLLFDTDSEAARQPLIDAVTTGITASDFEGDVSVLAVSPQGLPAGTEHSFRNGFRELADAGALVIIGPGVTTTDSSLVTWPTSLDFPVSSGLPTRSSAVTGRFIFRSAP